MQQGKVQPGRIRWMIVFGFFLADVIFSQIIGAIIQTIDPQVGQNLGSPLSIVAWTLGLLSTVVAGALAGYFAKHERFLHGVLVGGLGVILALIVGLEGEPLSSADIVLTVLAVPLAGLAAHLTHFLPRQRD